MSRPPGEPAAYAALKRGTAFLRAACGAPTSPMVVGNALAELDRLLRVLIVQAARDRGVGLSARSRGNADRLALVCGAHLDGRRLQALRHSATCLRRHGGRARNADRRGCRYMTVGWPNPASPDAVGLHRIELGESIVPSAEQIGDVCMFYDRLAHRLVAVRAVPSPAFLQRGLVLEAA